MVNNVAQLQRVAVVIAHELGHQWFGNLVTAQWWSELWLNEGFATYVEYIGADASNPELLMRDQFISVAQRQALVFDSTINSHPIINDNTVTGSFDNIDYAKGGSVLRMMQGMLGEEVFITGVRNYLRHFQYSNAYSTDLFSQLTAAASAANMNVNVTNVMYEWTAIGTHTGNTDNTDTTDMHTQTLHTLNTHTHTQGTDSTDSAEYNHYATSTDHTDSADHHCLHRHHRTLSPSTSPLLVVSFSSPLLSSHLTSCHPLSCPSLCFPFPFPSLLFLFLSLSLSLSLCLSLSPCLSSSFCPPFPPPHHRSGLSSRELYHFPCWPVH